MASWYLCVEAFSVHVIKLKWVLLSIPRLTTWEPETDAILGADTVLLLLFFFLRLYLFIFIERGREGERETLMCGLPLSLPLLGTWPTTQACALTGNRTGHPLIRRLALNPLSHSSQGRILF